MQLATGQGPFPRVNKRTRKCCVAKYLTNRAFLLFLMLTLYFVQNDGGMPNAWTSMLTGFHVVPVTILPSNGNSPLRHSRSALEGRGGSISEQENTPKEGNLAFLSPRGNWRPIPYPTCKYNTVNVLYTRLWCRCNLYRGRQSRRPGCMYAPTI